MASYFNCKCGVQLTVAPGQAHVTCPKCGHVLAVSQPEAKKLTAKNTAWLLLALAGILLVCLYFGVRFLPSGGSGQEKLPGTWEVDRDTVAVAPGELRLVYRGKGAFADTIRARIKEGAWKIVEEKDQKLVVEVSSPREAPERLQIDAPDQEQMQMQMQMQTQMQSTVTGKPAAFDLPRTGPRMARVANKADSHGAPQTTSGGSSSQGGANYSLIEEGLYQGGLVSEPPPDSKTVINLCETLDQYRNQISSYLWVPIADAAPAPSIDWLKQMVNDVDAGRRDGKTVYVHCHAGISRSGMVVTAYCMFEHKWARDRALDFVRTKRPATRPNPAFMTLLAEWERSLQR